ncbi:MAG: hypothetical protein NW220_14645 [Leptolyngbyaceae cyanobacterium bins.349]|nr:hypothetical protein [Leptolyngbyaceae cyanobacterium bins.349]
MQLFYRGQVVDYSTHPVPRLQSARAVNWRYQVSGHPDISPTLPVSSQCPPNTMNWRFRAVVDV